MALPQGPVPLADVHDAEIETLIAEVYRKDFLNFGFAPWEP